MPEREVRFSETLKSLIKNSPLKVDDIAKRVMVSPSAVSQYSGGRAKPKFETLVALANVFDVSLDYLVFGESQGPQQALDFGPLGRSLDISLSNLQAEASRRTAAVQQIGLRLAAQMSELADGIAETSGALYDGMIRDDDSLLLEGYALNTDLLTMDLAYDISGSDDDSQHHSEGRFLPVVADNLAAGRKYRILLPERDESWGTTVQAFKRLLADRCGMDRVSEHLEVGLTSAPLVVGMVIYQLDLERMTSESAVLLESFRRYIFDERMAYAISPSENLLADALFDEFHCQNASSAFETLWSDRGPIST